MSYINQNRGGNNGATTSSTVSSQFYTYRHRDNEKFCNKCRNFIWNKEAKTICGRTTKSWCTILLFYLLFLLVIIGIFCLMTYTWLWYIKRQKLPWIDKKTIDRAGPGLAYMPHIVHTESPMIWYTFSDEQESNNMKPEAYISYINEFFRKYEEAENDNKFIDCKNGKNPNKFCLFKKSDLGPCGTKNYGYDKKKPCFYLKLNKLQGWKPQYYEDNLPSNMPDSLKKVINSTAQKEMIWVNCKGTSLGDSEHFGTFSYYPQQGFPGVFYPYNGNKHYLAPIVAVKADNIKPGYVVNIICRPWAKNIINSENDKSILVQFYLDLN